MNKNKKQKNIIFITIIITLFIILFILNYKIDPYCFFHQTNLPAQIFVNKTENANIYIKGSKKQKRETVVIGASEIVTMFGRGPLDYIFNRICLRFYVVKFKNYYELLKLYINNHPETKNVIIVINYPSFFTLNKDYPKSKSNNYSLKELFYLFFSLDTTKKSLKILKNMTINNNVSQSDSDIYIENGFYNIYIFSHYFKNKNFLKETNEDIEFLDKTIKFLKEKNINYYVIIPPYSAISLYAIYSDQRAIDEINKIKKKLVEKVDVVYDFAFINKYTNIDFFNINYLYYDYQHPNWIYGIKIYKLFFDEKNSEKDIVMILNKENIESSIDKQKELYNRYYSDNINNLKKYLEISKVINNDTLEIIPSLKWEKQDLPDQLLQELNYAKRIRKIYKETKI